MLALAGLLTLCGTSAALADTLVDTFVDEKERAAAAPRILVMGDSISAAYGIQREEGWVHLLGKRLRELELGWQVVNASISGETTGGGLARLPQAMAAHDPDLVIIELGGNDALRGYPISRVRDNLEQMVRLALSQERQVLLVGMQIPPNYGPRYTKSFFDMYPAVASATGAALVPFLLQEVALTDGFMQDDGIHPTADAQPVLLDTLWTYLEPML